jgi:hypothetical protein
MTYERSRSARDAAAPYRITLDPHSKEGIAAQYKAPHSKRARWRWRREWLAYGCWIVRGGPAVIFNRSYVPLFERWPDGTVIPAPWPPVRYDFAWQFWFTSDASPTSSAALQRITIDFISNGSMEFDCDFRWKLWPRRQP